MKALTLVFLSVMAGGCTGPSPDFSLAKESGRPVQEDLTAKPPTSSGRATDKAQPLTPMDGKEGFFTDATGRVLDLRGFPPGSEIRDPYTNIIYTVP